MHISVFFDILCTIINESHSDCNWKAQQSFTMRAPLCTFAMISSLCIEFTLQSTCMYGFMISATSFYESENLN